MEQGDDMDGLLRLLDGIKQRPPHPLALLTAQEAWRVRASKARRRAGAGDVYTLMLSLGEWRSIEWKMNGQ